jgi:hypothetical protein
MEEATFDTLGSFPALAVDDQGQATLVFNQRPNRIIALALESGALIERVNVQIRWLR